VSDFDRDWWRDTHGMTDAELRQFDDERRQIDEILNEANARQSERRGKGEGT
jgi:hypothetical protein